MLDGDGGGTVTLALDTIAESALARVPHVDVSARLRVGGIEIAKTTRRIASVAIVPVPPVLHSDDGEPAPSNGAIPAET